MRFKMMPVKVCTLIILGIVTFGFALSSLDAAVTDYERQQASISRFSNHSPAAPSVLFVLKITQPTSESSARLLQILFILFIISPPLIVIFLFLIWKELKAGNKLK